MRQGLVVREDGTAKMSAWARESMEEYCKKYRAYLAFAKTERRAYSKAVELLEAHGFRALESCQTLHAGDKVYRGYHGKTLFAAVVGSRPVREGMAIVGGHTDAPRFDLKPVPVMEKGGVAYFDLHYYGGIKKFQWVAHPLALYGVVVKKDGTKVEIEVGDKPGDPVFMISDILPHFGRDQMEKPVKDAFPGEGLDLLVGSTVDPVADANEKERVKSHILRLLQEKYGIEEEDFLSAELEVVPAGEPRELGFDRALMIGYGHDDRVCAYAGLQALLDVEGVPSRSCGVVLCDKEEIGSVGATGMESTFFENSVAELMARTGDGSEWIDVRRALERSSMLSADVSAAADPHFPDADSPNNMARLHAGPCMIKYTGAGGKSCASDARAEWIARLRGILDESHVAWQMGELGQVEKGGGGTIAKFMARYGMDVVDFGTPLLNMHAPWEAASKFDAFMTYRAYRAFFEKM